VDWNRFAADVGRLYCPEAALNLATRSAGTRPRSFTSMPWALELLTK